MAGKHEKKREGYIQAVTAAAPVFGLKAVVGDMPKGAIEHAVENKTLGGALPFSKYLAQGFRGRGAGRALGAGLGILSAPFYLKGTSLLTSRDKAEKRKGYAYIAGSTAGLAAAKGFFEKALQARVSGANPLAAAASGGLTAGVRAGYKIPLALATAAGIAAGRSKSEDSPHMKYVVPLAAGAGAGALSRAIEEAAEMGVKQRSELLTRKGLRRLGAAGAGGAAGGVLGGLVLAKAVDLLAKPKEKKAGISSELLLAAAKRAGLALGESYGVAIGQHALTGAGYGYKAQSKSLGKLIPRKLLAAHQAATNRGRARQVAFGIHEGLRGAAAAPGNLQMRANFGVGLAGMSPEAVAYRELGITLGRKLRDVPEAERAQTLRHMQNFLVKRPGTLLGPEGELNPLTGPALGGIAMALGERDFYTASKHLPTFKGLYTRAQKIHPGLPTQLGELQKTPGWLRQNAAHFATVAASAPLAVLGIPGVSQVAGHGAISGAKNIIASTPFVKKVITRSMHKGIQYGMFPNKEFKPNLGLELALSPATTMMERSLKPVVRSVRDEELAKLIGKTRAGLANAYDQVRAEKSIDLYPAQVLAPIAAGLGTGAAGALLLRKKKQKAD